MLALLFAAVASASTLAVLPFEKGSAPAAYEGMGHALAAMVTTDMTLVEGVQVVERARLDDLLGELDLSQTSYVDKDTALQVGRVLAADHVVVGDWSVLADKLVIDARIVTVQTGKIAKAARATGPVDDFVSVEKEAVEALVGNLSLNLSSTAKRKLFSSAPTESVEAFTAYGTGLERNLAGDAAGAAEAFQAALVADPAFLEAKAELERLGGLVADAESRSIQAKLDAEVAKRERALAETIDERTRKRSFRHDERSIARWMHRLDALKRTGQHCVRYAEMRAYLEREGLPTRDRYDFQALRRAAVEEGISIGRWPDVPGWEEHFAPPPPGWATSRPLPREYESVPGDFAHLVNEPADFLWELPGWAVDPADLERGDGLLSSLHSCLEGQDEVAEIEAVYARVEGDPALAGIYDDYEVFTVQEVFRGHVLATRAWKRGPDAEIAEFVESILARPAPDSTGAFRARGMADRIVRYGERWARDQEAAERAAKAAALSEKKRMGFSEEALVGILHAIVDENPGLLALDTPLCQAAVKAKQSSAEHRLDQLADFAEDGRDASFVYDDLWHIVASTRALGCLTGIDGEFATIADIYAHIDAVALPEEPSRDCRTWVRSFRDNWQRSAARMDPDKYPVPAAQYAVVSLDEYHRLSFMGCLDE